MNPEEFPAVWQHFLNGDEKQKKAAFESIYNECNAHLLIQAKKLFVTDSGRKRYYEPRDLVHDAFLVLSKKRAADFINPIIDLNGLRAYLYGTLKYIYNNFARKKFRDDQGLPFQEFADQDLFENPFSNFPSESRLVFLKNDRDWRFSEIFNGKFRANHELCHDLLNAHYVDELKYNELIIQNRFPDYQKSAALMQVAHRNKESLKKLL